MAFVEDNTQYLADFGLNCVSNGVNFQALFDQPDDDFNVGNATFQSREYKLTYITSSVTLKTADIVVVEGANYFVRNYPNTIDDGTWCEAMLSKS